MNEHDVLMALIWPLATAALNLLIHLAGASEHPAAKLFARVGTVALDLSKKQAK